MLALAAAVERGSEHPLAAAMIEAARARGLALAEAHDFRSVAGEGVAANVAGRSVLVGNRRFLEAARRGGARTEQRCWSRWTEAMRDR